MGEALNDRFGDFLGECYHSLSVQSSARQQFFTPYSVSKTTAKQIFCDEEKIKQQINKQGYISIYEPGCGGGGLLIACLERLKELNVNYQHNVLIIAQDVDYRCIYMCYIVMCLLCVPAIITLGNTLKNENKFELKTPFYWLNFYKFNSDLRNP